VADVRPVPLPGTSPDLYLLIRGPGPTSFGHGRGPGRDQKYRHLRRVAQSFRFLGE